MPEFSPETANFIHELDAAVDSHLDWTHRVLRCAVLSTSPGDDVLTPSAHTLCRFGHWFVLNKPHFERLDEQKTLRLIAVHQTMHDAIRTICTDLLNGRKGQSIELDIFEKTQDELIYLLAEFKTQILANAARLDPLTGLPLRYGLEIEFNQVQKCCLRNNIKFYVGMIDVDHFKRVNDHHGHAVGDMALRHLASTLNSVVRANEPLFRFGGEEFLLLMQCQTDASAAVMAQRIVQIVRSTPMLTPQGDLLPLTITMGIAPVAEEESMASAVARADKALYAGKHAGRDRFVIADHGNL